MFWKFVFILLYSVLPCNRSRVNFVQNSMTNKSAGQNFVKSYNKRLNSSLNTNTKLISIVSDFTLLYLNLFKKVWLLIFNIYLMISFLLIITKEVQNEKNDSHKSKSLYFLYFYFCSVVIILFTISNKWQHLLLHITEFYKRREKISEVKVYTLV